MDALWQAIRKTKIYFQLADFAGTAVWNGERWTNPQSEAKKNLIKTSGWARQSNIVRDCGSQPQSGLPVTTHTSSNVVFIWKRMAYLYLKVLLTVRSMSRHNYQCNKKTSIQTHLQHRPTFYFSGFIQKGLSLPSTPPQFTTYYAPPSRQVQVKPL